MVDALKASGINKVCIGTPYPDWINQLEKKFLEDAGFSVIYVKTIREDLAEIFGIDRDATNPEIAHLVNALPPERVYEFTVEKLYDNECDGIFLSCMGLPTLGVIDMLERDLDKIVISSNQVTLWKLLKMAGIETKESMRGYGSLFTR